MTNFQYQMKDDPNKIAFIEAPSRDAAQHVLKSRRVAYINLVGQPTTSEVHSVFDVFDAIVTVVRLPLCVVAMVTVAAFHFTYFVAETAIAFVWLPIAVVIYSKSDLRRSWIARYPNVIRFGFGGEEHLTISRSYHQTVVSYAFEVAKILLGRALFPPNGLVKTWRKILVWLIA